LIVPLLELPSTPNLLVLESKESISSMKMMQGLFFLASSNSSQTLLAPTPTNISSKSLPVQ